MTILQELREAAAKAGWTSFVKKRELNEVADELSGRIAVLYSDPTRQALIDLNGCFARAQRLMWEAENGKRPKAG